MSSASSPTGLQWIDWVIIAGYAGGTIGLGWYFSRKQRSTEEYFVGSGKMNPILIGVSLFATLLSTISYLSIPGEMIGKGPVTMASLLTLPLAFLFVGRVLLPIYMKQRVTSAYELLEKRLGVSIRMLGAGLFISLRLVWMSLLIYLAAKAMTVMMGVGDDWIPYLVLGTGFVSVIYTSLGGLQAVVITDFFQAALLLGGAIVVILMITFDLGGFSWFPTSWQSQWDSQPVFSWDPSTRVTLVGTIISTFIWYVCTAGGDQTSVQRFMATEDARAAKKAYATQLVTGAIVLVTLALVGCALMGFFQQRPELLPAGMDLDKNADHIFPRFIAYHLPAGLSGLVVSAMFAAAMSSVDSGINSITAVVMSDFLDRFGKKPATEADHVRLAKILAFCLGAVIVVGSSFMGHVPGNITGVTQKTTNLLVTPIFSLFFFALFVPFARPPGVWAGALCGMTAAILIAFSGPIFGTVEGTGYDPVSFQWIGLAALVVNIGTGSLVSLLIVRAEKGRG